MALVALVVMLPLPGPATLAPVLLVMRTAVAPYSEEALIRIALVLIRMAALVLLAMSGKNVRTQLLPELDIHVQLAAPEKS